MKKFSVKKISRRIKKCRRAVVKTLSGLTIFNMILTPLFIAGVFVAIPLPTAASVVDTGFLAPTANSASGTVWTTPANGYTSNNSYATANATPKGVSYKTFYIPAIPAGSTIDGIEVSIEGLTTGRQANVDLSWNNGTNYTTGAGTGIQATTLTGTEGTIFLGGSTDKWGTSHAWAVSNFTNANFRVRLISTGTTGTISVDQVRAKVYYTPDITSPAVSLINLGGPSPTNDSPVTWAVTFSESVTGVNSADFSLVKTGLGGTPAITGVSGSGATYTVTASTGSGSGTLGLNLVDNDSIVDAASNKLGGTGTGNGNFTGQVYTIDRTAPTVTINQAEEQADPTNVSPINFTVIFSEPVTGFATGDVSITGTAGGTKIATVTGSEAAYNVAVTGMTFGGTVIAKILAGKAKDLVGNNNTASASIDNQVTYYNYAITASADVGGTISPSGLILVDSGDDETFTITPNSGYIVSDVLVDGVSVGAVGNYTFNNVIDDHTISANFDGGWSAPAANAHSSSVTDANAQKAYSSDNQRTSFDGSNDWVNYINFGLGIPETAIINGIGVSAEGYATNLGDPRQADISLSWNGVDYTTDSGVKTTNMPGTTSGDEATRIFGGDGDLWNRIWSSGDFSDGNFRVKLDATANTGILYLDQIQVKVYYMLPATSLAVAASGIYGDTATLTAALTSGSGVSGKTINFTLNGASVGSAITDADGVAILNDVSLDGINAGSYSDSVGASFAGDFNYGASDGMGDLTVEERPITVTAVTDTKTYDGTTDSTGTPTITSGDLATGDTENWTQTFDNKNVGDNKTLIPTGAVNDGNGGDNYDVTFVNDTTGVISARAIVVTAVTDTKVYDGTTSSAGTPTIITGSLATGDMATWTQTFDNENVGTGKTLTPGGTVNDGNNGDNYNVTFANNAGVVSARPITVTADAKNKNYGDANPLLTYEITIGSLAGVDEFAGGLSREEGEDVGTYAIEKNDLALSDNYILTYVGANLTIETKPITVIAAAMSKIYGESDPSPFTYIFSPDLISGDSFSGFLSRVIGEDVGAYTIGIGSLSLSHNYDPSFTGADFTIDKRDITVTADNQQKNYGEDDPDLTYQISGSLVGSDSLTGSLSRVPGEEVGTYAISRGTLTAGGNYNLTFTPGAFLTIKDNVAPVITLIGDDTIDLLVGDEYAEQGATAYDEVDGVVAAIPSGLVDTAHPGHYVVTYTATDAAGNHSSIIRTVNVSDVNAPVISGVPENMTVEATSAAGAHVSYILPTAVDDADGEVSVSCVPSSGSVFPIGETSVSCSAQDATGNEANDSFSVIVRDMTAPVITVPDDQPFEATGTLTTPNLILATAVDLVDANPTIDYSPKKFPLGETTVIWTATDAMGNQSSATSKVTITDTTSPIITLNGDSRLTVEVHGVLDNPGVTVTDNHDTDLAATATGDVDVDTVGSYTLYYNAADSSGNPAEEKMLIIDVVDTTVPVIAAHDDITAEATSVDGAAVDYDLPIVTDNYDTGLVAVCDPVSGSEFPIGETTITCSATDNKGNPALPTTFKVTITNPAPVASDLSKTTDEDMASSFNLIANDSNGDPLTYSITTGPAHGKASLAGNEITYMPDENYNGSDSFTFKANDGTSDSNEAAVSITVNPVNDAPALDEISSQSVSETSSLEFKVFATDIDEDSLIYSASDLPDGANFDAATQTFSWTPNYDQAGTYSPIFKVCDSSLCGEKPAAVTVSNTNRPPVLNSIDDQLVTQGANLRFSVSGSDPDNDSLTYSASELPDGASFDSAARNFSWRPNQPGDYLIKFLVSDGELSAEQTAKITVRGAGVTLLQFLSGNNNNGGGNNPANNSPLSITATIGANQGGSASLPGADGSNITVSVPAGATSQGGLVLSITTGGLQTPQQNNLASHGLIMAGNKVYSITANSNNQSVTSFAEPLTVTINYSDSQIGGLDEVSLEAFWWDPAVNVWVSMGGQVDSANNQLTFTTNHLSTYSLAGAKAKTVLEKLAGLVKSASVSLSGEKSVSNEKTIFAGLESLSPQIGEAAQTEIPESSAAIQAQPATSVSQTGEPVDPLEFSASATTLFGLSKTKTAVIVIIVIAILAFLYLTVRRRNRR